MEKHDGQGNDAELLFAYEAITRHYRVALPFGGKAPYDFVLERRGKCWRVQVKRIYFGKTSSGYRRWMVDFMKPRGGQRYLKVKHYTHEDCDLLVAVCPEHKAFFFFPVEEIAAKRQASFYFDEQPHDKARHTAWAIPFRDRWPR